MHTKSSNQRRGNGFRHRVFPRHSPHMASRVIAAESIAIKQVMAEEQPGRRESASGCCTTIKEEEIINVAIAETAKKEDKESGRTRVEAAASTGSLATGTGLVSDPWANLGKNDPSERWRRETEKEPVHVNQRNPHCDGMKNLIEAMQKTASQMLGANEGEGTGTSGRSGPNEEHTDIVEQLTEMARRLRIGAEPENNFKTEPEHTAKQPEEGMTEVAFYNINPDIGRERIVAILGGATRFERYDKPEC